MIPMEWLSPRERQVYERRAAGMTNAQVAAELGITLSNVKGSLIYAKRRIANGGPRSVPRAKPGRSLLAQREAMRRFDEAAAAEAPCARCHLRGHVAGDPERCISIYVVASSGRN
jgi:hypothetical protein